MNAENQSRPVASATGSETEYINLCCEHAKEKAKLPDNWRIFKWQCFPGNGEETIYIAVTGAVCDHLFTAGKRKGQRKWSARDRSTERTVNLPVAEHTAWKLQWEQRTRKCSECTGSGRVFASWSIKEGTKYRKCSKCNGSGSPNKKGEP